MVCMGGLIGEVAMTSVAEDFIAFRQHRLSKHNSESLLISSACHGGYLQQTAQFQKSPFFMVTVKGLAKGGLHAYPDNVIAGPFLELFGQRILIDRKRSSALTLNKYMSTIAVPRIRQIKARSGITPR